MRLSNFIGGAFLAPMDGQYLDNFNPSTGEKYGEIPDSTQADVQLAIEAAQKVQPLWANTPAEEKFKIMNRIAELIDENREKLAKAESEDQGKPLWLARNEMNRAAQNFRFFATASMQFASESHAMEDKAINYTLRQPIGVVGCISPWNLPLYLFTWKIAPAIAAGNAVVAKPSEFTPVTAFLLCELCNEAGLPAGVLNVVHGLGAKTGQAIVESKHTKAISFTGGTATGKHLAATAVS